MRELPIPPDARKAKLAVEIARGWIIDNRLQCSLLPSIWSETPEAWGILLADFMSHVAQALAKESDLSEEQLLRIISKKLIEELNMPTGDHSGDFVDWD